VAAADTDLAFVNPRVVSWALKNGGVSRAALAGKLKVSVDQLAAWERPDSHPPFPKAQLLAKTLRIPFGYLFLPDPPSLDLPLPDFRNFDAAYRPSPNLRELLNDVMVKQDWYRDLMREQKAPKLKFVASFDLGADVADVAADIRQTLGVTSNLKAIRPEDIPALQSIREFQDFQDQLRRAAAAIEPTNNPDAYEDQMRREASTIVNAWRGTHASLGDELKSAFPDVVKSASTAKIAAMLTGVAMKPLVVAATIGIGLAIRGVQAGSRALHNRHQFLTQVEGRGGRISASPVSPRNIVLENAGSGAPQSSCCLVLPVRM
jgi:transcriptional regulator with XRE-family HTH domain